MARLRSQSPRGGPAHRVVFQPSGIGGPVPEGTALLEAAAAHAIELRSECGGRGTCGQCLVEITPAHHASSPSINELRLLSAEAVEKGRRLACQARVVGPLSVSVPVSALERGEAPGKELGDTVLPRPRRGPGAAAPRPGALGLAMDIGTTTLAVYLCDLNSGVIVASAAAANPQRRFGADVISRIAHALEHRGGLEDLHQAVIEAVNGLTGRCLRSAGSDREAIEKVTVAGNTTMQHLFAGLHPGCLGVSPYMPASCAAGNFLAGDLGLDLRGTCPVYLFPVLSGFVGGDTVAVMLSEKPYTRDEISLIIDIGTNGEIVLGNRQALWGTSCATGPALEGAHIQCGMRASSGAIDKVWIESGSCRVDYHAIGPGPGEKVRGLCGSGIIDAVAGMVRAGLILPSGRLREGLPGIVVDEGGIGREFVLVPSDPASGQRRVVLTLADVRQVQLAKAALAAGIMLLMEKAGIDSIDRLVLTGAFGARFDWRNGVAIGMLPAPGAQTAVEVVENAAGRGAVLALLDEELRAGIEAVAGRVRVLDLAGEPAFAMEFARQTSFPQR